MVATHCTVDDLSQAARAVGLQLMRPRPEGRSGIRFRLQLGPDRHYQRTSPGSGRRVGAVCWHGHRDYFRALWAIAPGARVQTAQTRRFPKGARWYTAETFEDQYRATDINVGSRMAPCRYSSACTCDWPERYRDDGSCRPVEQARMIREWGYQAVSIPASRPYLDPKMKPSEMMRAYVIKTWGSDFGQNDLIDAVVNAAAKEGFVPGRPTRRGGPRVKTLGDQKRNVLNWMDWNDKGLREQFNMGHAPTCRLDAELAKR